MEKGLSQNQINLDKSQTASLQKNQTFSQNNNQLNYKFNQSKQQELLYQNLQKLTANAQKQSELTALIKKLPQQFWNFMKQRQINLNEVLVQTPRYIRVKPKQEPNTSITIQILAQDLQTTPQNIVQVDQNVFALASHCKINHSNLYQSGYLYGIDISSIIAIRALQIENGNKVLQLCSAPGNKAMYACDLCPDIKVIGVQINVPRANIMKSLIKKYKLQDRITVIIDDATTYQAGELFDRVLVDAQCTHQGSVKHLKKFVVQDQQNNKQKKSKKKIKEQKKFTKQQQKQYQQNNTNPYTTVINKANNWTMNDFQQRFLDPVKLNNLKNLQLNLIKNGFKHLKEGGIMIYSTCSIDETQNQHIVRQFLKLESTAVLLDASENLNCKMRFKRGTIAETIRLSPQLSLCGGMFISKIKKISLIQSNKK